MSNLAENNVTLLDDSAIVALAADEAEPLLRVLERSKALRPLIVVLAVLPGFIALQRHGMDDFSSVWALRALSAMEAGNVADFIDPGTAGRTAGLSAQPPLATWLTALFLWIVGPTFLNAPLIVPLLATAGCVWWTFRLFGVIAGPRRAFWAAVLLSMNGGLLLIATNSAPTALTLFLVLVVFDSWVRHFIQRKGSVSTRLLVSGLALGLCLLSGGPIVFAVLLVLIVMPAFDRVFSASPSSNGKTPRSRQKTPSYPVAIGVTVLTAFVVGGWWLMQAATTMDGFWAEWLGGYETATLAASGAELVEFHRLPPQISQPLRACVVIGPLLPLCIYGLIRVCIDRHPEEPPASRTERRRPASPALLVSWLTVAFAYHIVAPDWETGYGPGRTLANAFLLVPAVGLAAYGINAILQRRTTIFEAFLLSAVILLILPLIPNWERGTPGNSDFVMLTIGTILAGSILVGWRLHRWTGKKESRRRIAIGFCVAVQLVATIIGCLLSLSTLPKDDQRLLSIRAQLQPVSNPPPSSPSPSSPSLSNVGEIILITDETPPARLEYSLRSIRPNARWRMIDIRNTTATVGDLLANSRHDKDILVVEWLSVRKQTALGDIKRRKLIAVGSPRFYRNRDLRISILILDDGP